MQPTHLLHQQHGMSATAATFMTQREAVPHYGTVRVTIDGTRLVPYTHTNLRGGDWAAWLVWLRAAVDDAPLPILHVMPQRCTVSDTAASFNARQNMLERFGLAPQDISKITQLTPRENDLRDRIAITGDAVMVVITELKPIQLSLAQRQHFAEMYAVSVGDIDSISYSTNYMRAYELENDTSALNDRLQVEAVSATIRIDVQDMLR